MIKILENIRIREANSNDANSITNILIDSFTDKFTLIFGKKVREGQKALSEDYICKKDFEGVFVAENNKNVVGIIELSIVETRRSKLESWKPYFVYLGVYRAIRALLAFLILEEQVDVKSCYVEHVAVSPNSRGIGIGELLMKKAEKFAKENQKDQCLLYVVQDNKVAYDLYREIGYSDLGPRKSILLKLFLGKQVFILMRRHSKFNSVA